KTQANGIPRQPACFFMIEHKSIHRDKKSPLTAWSSAVEWLFSFRRARGLGCAEPIATPMYHL
ncbi:MAG TPA: hypothetical protein QGH16_09195, partial [Verrucomicrobiota bacterium]|nr:hypothetical protein [Verrucomicrobiota bacterium]